MSVPPARVAVAAIVARPRAPEPYRVMFPIGIAFGLIGAGLWPLHALGLDDDPGVPHRSLMILGFEQAFVLGFLLTAMPGLTHGERCRPWELALAAGSVLGLGLATLLGHPVIAALGALLAIAVISVALLRRAIAGRGRLPDEFAFVALALSAGLAGATLRLTVAFGIPVALPQHFGDRLTSLGMILPLVLGLGSLLVPTFAGMRDPLVIPGVAGPHESRGRRVLYLALVLTLAGSFAADLAQRPRLGHTLRALPAWVLMVWVWRPWRRGRSGAAAWALRLAGPLAALGVTLAAIMPAHEIAALHVTFIGGYALLTLAIGTRVIVSHGRRPLTLEAAALSGWTLSAIGAALVLRLVAELELGSSRLWLASSALAWWAAWIVWAFHAVPALVARTPSRTPAGDGVKT